MVKEERMRENHSLWSVLRQCWLFDRKDIRPIKIPCHLSTEVMLLNKWRKNQGGLANQVYEQSGQR